MFLSKHMSLGTGRGIGIIDANVFFQLFQFNTFNLLEPHFKEHKRFPLKMAKIKSWNLSMIMINMMV